MLRYLLPLAAIGLIAADTPPGADTRPLPSCAEWAGKPSGDDFAAAISKYAPNLRGGAEVVLGCVVGEDMRPKDCRALTTTTPDTGVVKAALAVSTHFKIRGKTKDCEIAGTYFKIPIRLLVER
jgi:hypothetical protein